ncbi:MULTISPECIES: SsrA-binding protein SmpB [Desulfovibrio]|uniref:SsrA-binding protein n=3 Tax=Desulfovibrio TaxID=872 RepID=A0AA94HQW0_DESDE|nr:MULTISPECIES: SsrA-binding protein SmpB [Desulfovibrio]ATD80583.1 SsrA-binding protein SmpB [Desulfovibrio sp. G11]MDY0203221.1 SsrA-binding protein SmpB [Desulfovibrio desulfuricans]SFW21788.1 SsrA-binding protein [Desulfovibrio desulfuricans]SPD36085.1 SsrA-binding protein/small protein B [Desulfovibrio sp. G11]
MSQKTSPSTIAVNKKARHLYELSEFTEAGVVLTGPEVKSIRAGKVNFVDSYVDFRRGEAWLLSLHIAPYSNAGYAPQEPERARKLLLHQREIAKLSGIVAQKGLTVVPVRLYLKRGKIKVEIAVGRGKKLHDHRESLKRRAEERDLARELS